MKQMYQQYQPLLFKVAYQLTGSASDAEDAVQDVFLKLYEVNLDRIYDPKAYLCKMITNRCLDLLKSARKRREQYVGNWLPEPVLTPNDDRLQAVEHGELLSYAMLVLLERLSPAERAVFVLREGLGFAYPELAEMTGKSETNCRKLYSRARNKMGITQEQPITPELASEEWVRRFLHALEQGRVDAVVSLLAENVVLISDGGGKAVAALHPILSRDRVARFLVGLVQKIPEIEGGVTVEVREINGQSGLIIRAKTGIEMVALLHIQHNKIRNLYLVRNPDKLRQFSV